MVKIAVLSVLFLPAAAHAATLQNAAAENSRRLDKELGAIAAEITEAEGCFEGVYALQAENAAKRQKLAAEFKGTVPMAFSDMLAMKAARVTKAKQRCVDKNAALTRRLAELFQTMSSMYPPSPNIKAQRARATDLNKRQLAAMEKVSPRKPGSPGAPMPPGSGAPGSAPSSAPGTP